MTASFFGVRGSTPCHGPEIVRYGGNTSCVGVQIPGAEPILLDLGTGLRYFGAQQPRGVAFGSLLYKLADSAVRPFELKHAYMM